MFRKIAFLLCFFLMVSALSAQELLTSSEFHVRATGFAGTKSTTYKVFSQALAKGESSRPLFEKCLKEGTAAARLYGAVGLYHLDPKAGRQALVDLRTDQGKVGFLQGCLKRDERVGDLAAELLSKDRKTLSFDSFLP